MRRRLFPIFFANAALFTSCAAQAGGADFYADTGSVIVRMQVIEKKLANNDAKYSLNRPGHYVFIASARPDGAISVGTIENVAACTGVRPRFGLTQPAPGYFRFPAYAIYYGPYASIEEAAEARSAVSICVPDAYNKEGFIHRFEFNYS